MKKIFKKIINKWNELFSFELGVDITNDTQVLFRRNVVVKNIIFLSNLVYSIILLVISIAEVEVGNLVLTILFFPLTFLINLTLKKMIYNDKTNLIKQQIAMYIGCFYMFVSALVIYLRLTIGVSDNFRYLEFVGYLLIYISLLVSSLYQDKKVLMTVFFWMFIIITILHFTVTHGIYKKDYANSLDSILKIFKDQEFKDILLRTIILLLYMVILYSITAIGQYMQQKRKEELIKRQNVQNDFKRIVSELFNAVLGNKTKLNDELKYIDLLKKMSINLANKLMFNKNELEILKEYSDIHIKEYDTINNLFSLDNKMLNEQEFEELKIKTETGEKIVKRIQLKQKCEDILRAHTEGYYNDGFILNMNQIQKNKISDIILLCDLYISLRSFKNYKRPYPNRRTMDLLDKEFRCYFDLELLNTFFKFGNEFETMFNEYSL